MQEDFFFGEPCSKKFDISEIETIKARSKFGHAFGSRQVLYFSLSSQIPENIEESQTIYYRVVLTTD
jgi:hypothetical protein